MNKRKTRIERVRKRLLLTEIEELEKFCIRLKRDFENRDMKLFGTTAENIEKFNKNSWIDEMPQHVSLERRIKRLEDNSKTNYLN